MKKLIFALTAALILAIPFPSLATDQDRPVLDVVIADVNGDLEGFLDRMNRIKGVAERLGTAGETARLPGHVRRRKER